MRDDVKPIDVLIRFSKGSVHEAMYVIDVVGDATGPVAPGFDDRLNAAGPEGEAVSVAMTTDLATAIEEVSALDDPLETTLRNDASALNPLDRRIEDIVSNCRHEMARILARDLPPASHDGEGD